MSEKWIVRKSDGRKGDLVIAQEGTPVSGGRISTVPLYESREGRQLNIANRIAAVPEMEGALEKVAEYFGGYTCEAIDMVFLALKKSRGEA